MKIGIIIGSLGLGGAERVSVRLAEWWIGAGHQVSFYTTMMPPEKEYPLPAGATRNYCHKKGAGFGLIKSLRDCIKADAPDVVVVMDTPMCVYAVPALLGLGIPFVVSERSAPNHANIRRTTKALSRMLMGFANGFVFQTNGARDCYRSGIRRKSVVIPNPLAVDRLPEPYLGVREKRIVAMGRLTPAKNYPLLIAAFSIFAQTHPDYTLEIYGDGVLKDQIAADIRASDAAGQIFMMGAHNDVLEKVRKGAIYVLSSDYEGMPNALMEAMAIGLPSISTDCPSGGPKDLVDSGVNGILVPVAEPEAMAAAMSAIVENKYMQHTLSENGVRLRESLNIRHIGARWIDVLQESIR